MEAPTPSSLDGLELPLMDLNRFAVSAKELAWYDPALVRGPWLAADIAMSEAVFR
jgi:hypothetical protein